MRNVWRWLFFLKIKGPNILIRWLAVAPVLRVNGKFWTWLFFGYDSNRSCIHRVKFPYIWRFFGKTRTRRIDDILFNRLLQYGCIRSRSFFICVKEAVRKRILLCLMGHTWHSLSWFCIVLFDSWFRIWYLYISWFWRRGELRFEYFLTSSV